MGRIQQRHPRRDDPISICPPSQNAAYAYIVLFGVATAIHFILMFVFRAAFFIPMVIGDAMEAGGYHGRAWSHRESHSVKAYVLQSLLILSAPPLLSATIYVSLGRIIVSLRAEGYSIIKPRCLTPLFVLVDVVCFVTQMGGAGVQVSGSESLRVAGEKIVLGGLIFQIFVFSFFVSIAIKWRRQMWALYVVSVFVLLRNIVRIAQFTEGGTGFINTHEAMIYVFDATLMWLVMVVFGFVHPGKLRKDIRNAEKRTSPFNDDHTMLMINDGNANSGRNRF
ncbi:hypothetical protein VTN00DRAFT_9016 [Thermoascus crustaceus]|uniref:uncharacterized protein n=1 Tax=Thermoascus crustaceus TaxID=5088 RepID=UPI003742D0A1